MKQQKWRHFENSSDENRDNCPNTYRAKLRRCIRKTCGAFCLLAALTGSVTAAMMRGDVHVLQASGRLDEVLVKAPDQKVTGFAVSASTIDSVTLTWTKASDAQTYYISYWESGKPGTSVDRNDIGNVSEYTVTNLNQKKYIFQIQPANKLHTGIPLKGAAVSVTGAPSPAEPSGVSFQNTKAGYCSLYLEGMNDIYKSEAEVYDASGILLESCEGNSGGAAVEEEGIRNNGFYAVRVRGFYDQEGGFRSYGDWTDLYYFSTPVKPLKLSQKNGKAVIKWNEVQGAQTYVIYMSKSASGGFKKVAETKNPSVSVAKFGGTKLKAKKTYYVRVTAKMTRDGQTYTAGSATGKIKIK